MPAQPQQPREVPPVIRAIFAGEQKFTKIPVPILAIFAVPHNLGPMFKDNPAALASAEALDAKETGSQAKAFEGGLPTARVVRLPNADHFVFRSNEADVLREMNAFLSKLPQP
jgi:non-heme chloroperoxidase